MSPHPGSHDVSGPWPWLRSPVTEGRICPSSWLCLGPVVNVQFMQSDRFRAENPRSVMNHWDGSAQQNPPRFRAKVTVFS